MRAGTLSAEPRRRWRTLAKSQGSVIVGGRLWLKAFCRFSPMTTAVFWLHAALNVRHPLHHSKTASWVRLPCCTPLLARAVPRIVSKWHQASEEPRIAIGINGTDGRLSNGSPTGRCINERRRTTPMAHEQTKVTDKAKGALKEVPINRSAPNSTGHLVHRTTTRSTRGMWRERQLKNPNNYRGLLSNFRAPWIIRCKRTLTPKNNPRAGRRRGAECATGRTLRRRRQSSCGGSASPTLQRTN